MKIILLALFLINTNFNGQEKLPSYDKLIIPINLKEAAYIAIKYFPELKNVDIEVIHTNTKTTMETRPVIGSLFSKRRKYKIFVDTTVENNFGVLVSEVPLDAKIGLFGHEFAHILDYENKSFLELMKIGRIYLNKGDIRSYETFIDQLAIQRGLGLYLKAWSDFVLNHSNASEEYKNYKRKNYLTSEEIQKSIDLVSIFNN